MSSILSQMRNEQFGGGIRRIGAEEAALPRRYPCVSVAVKCLHCGMLLTQDWINNEDYGLVQLNIGEHACKPTTKPECADVVL